MAQTIRELMSDGPIGMPKSATIAEAARRMRDENIGDVLVMDGEQMCGVVTDRDIVVRAVALDCDPDATTVDDICSHDLVTVHPQSDVSDAVELMRERAVRRLPVVEDGHAIGMITIGDLAIERDSSTALADISAARPNR
jgi:CBS domain-containing protein